MILRNLFAALTAAAMLATSAAYAGDVPVNDPAKEAEIRAVMLERGFEVRSVGTIDGKFEMYVVKDGAAFEIFLDRTLCIVDFKAA